jgi:hypothetical protein
MIGRVEMSGVVRTQGVRDKSEENRGVARTTARPWIGALAAEAA